VSAGDPEFAIAIGLISTVKCYKTLAFLSSLISDAKKKLLKKFGVSTCYVPESDKTKYPPGSYKNLAVSQCSEIPGAINLNELVTQDLVDTVGEEIAQELHLQLSVAGKIPNIVVGQNDGMFELFKSVTKSLRKKLPEKANCKMVHAEVLTIALQHSRHIFPDRMPGLEKINVLDPEGMIMARKFISEEGILCSPYAGSLLMAVKKALRLHKYLHNNKDFSVYEPDKDLEIVLIMDEHLYLGETQFLSDNWMLDRSLCTRAHISTLKWWDGISLSNMRLPRVPRIKTTWKCKKAMKFLKKRSKNNKYPLGILFDKSTIGYSCIQGIVDEEVLCNKLKTGELSGKDNIVPKNVDVEGCHIIPDFFGTLPCDATLGDLEWKLRSLYFVVIYKRVFTRNRKTGYKVRHVPVGICTTLDLNDYISEVTDHHRIDSFWAHQPRTIFDF